MQWVIVGKDGIIVEVMEVVGVEGSRVLFGRFRPLHDTVLRRGTRVLRADQLVYHSAGRDRVEHTSPDEPEAPHVPSHTALGGVHQHARSAARCTSTHGLSDAGITKASRKWSRAHLWVIKPCDVARVLRSSTTPLFLGGQAIIAMGYERACQRRHRLRSSGNSRSHQYDRVWVYHQKNMSSASMSSLDTILHDSTHLQYRRDRWG